MPANGITLRRNDGSLVLIADDGSYRVAPRTSPLERVHRFVDRLREMLPAR